MHRPFNGINLNFINAFLFENQDELDKAKPVYEFELRHLITKFDLKNAFFGL